MDEFGVFLLGRCVAKMCAIVQYTGRVSIGGWRVDVSVAWWLLLRGQGYHPHVGVVTFGGAHDRGVVVCYDAFIFSEVHLTSRVA
jgi:hypothetical protein